MLVWIVVRNYDYEGFDRPEACFSDSDKAIAYVRNKCDDDKTIDINLDKSIKVMIKNSYLIIPHEVDKYVD